MEEGDDEEVEEEEPEPAAADEGRTARELLEVFPPAASLCCSLILAWSETERRGWSGGRPKEEETS